jgi:hypothetical protein
VRTVTNPGPLNATAYRVSARVWVKDALGVFKDLSTLAGADWLMDVSWDDNLDQAVSQATVVLWRGSSTQSLAPLKKQSVLNQDAQGVFRPLLDMGREIKVEVATSAAGASPLSTDWQLVFHGDVDEVDWGKGEARVSLVARDLGGRLLDAFIEEERTYRPEDLAGAGATAVPVQTVMQRILDDNLGAGAVTLLVPPPGPGWNVGAYKQEKDSVLEALRKLAQQFGWDVRYRWDAASSSFRLKLFGPNRARVVDATHAADWTFTPSRYLDVTQLRLSRAGIRNYVRVKYVDKSGGALAGQVSTVDVWDSDSMAKYGRRFFELQEDTETSAIDTNAEATALAQAVLSDLADPKAEQEVEMHLFWPVELGDYYTFTANGEHYDEDQVGAVVAFKHHVSREQQRSTLTTRGRAAGAYRDWLRREVRVAGETTPAVVRYKVEPLDSPDGVSGTLKVTVTEGVADVRDVEFYVTPGLGGRTGPLSADRSPEAGVWEKDVTLHEQHASSVEPVILLADGRVLQPGSETFDQGRTPAVMSVTAEVTEAGSVLVTARGDTDTVGFRIAVRTDRLPTFGEVVGSLVYGSGTRETTSTFPLYLMPGQAAYVGVLAFNESDQASTLATTQTRRTDRVAPSASPSAALNAARTAADFSVVLESVVGEQVTLNVKDETSGTTWNLVAAQNDSTRKFVSPGATSGLVGPLEWFYDGTAAWARKLQAFPLLRDQVTRLLFQAEGKNLGARSTWVPYTVNVKEQPWLESVDLVWDETTDTMTMRGVGGAFTRSAKVEFADNEGFTGTTLSTQHLSATDGGAIIATRALTAAERGKTWHARITPFNAVLTGGVASGTPGAPQRDSVLVPASESGGIEKPTAVIAYVSESSTAFVLEMQGTLGAGGAGPLQYRTRYSIEGQEVAWTAWVSLPTPFPQLSFTRLGRINKLVNLEVKDAAGRTAADEFPVPARFGGLDGGTGQVAFDQPYAGQPATATPAYGHEGRRRVDTVYDTDGGIGYNVTIRDPDLGAGQYRSIRDTAKRAQTGLAAVDAAGNGGEVARTVPLARLYPSLPDLEPVNGRIATIASTAVATVRDNAATGRKGVGSDAENLLANAGGQESEHGVVAAGWNYGAGVSLVSSTAYAKFGDRALALIHDSAASSYSYQTVAASAGDVFEASAWIKIPAIATMTGAAVLNTDVNAGTVTVLETSAPFVSGPDVGVPIDRNWDWTFVRSLYRVESDCTLFFYLQLGYSANTWSYAFFDGVSLRRVTRYQAEGRRRIDTLYSRDAVLSPGVVAKHPLHGGEVYAGGVWRSAMGLADADISGNGGEITRNAPLSRVAAVLPDVDPATGRVATVAGASGATLVSRASGAQVNLNPQFTRQLTGYSVYDNSATGRVTHAWQTDPVAPNGSGYRMQVSTAAGASSINPGLGGFYVGIGPDAGTAAPGSYHRGAVIVWTVRASIPAGYRLEWASNQTGDGGTFEWLTPRDGTGTWGTYVGRQVIGTGGSFNTTGFWWINPLAGQTAVTWHVAAVDGIDTTQPPTAHAGVSLRGSTGVLLADTDIVTSQGTALDTARVGGTVAATVRDQAQWARTRTGLAGQQYIVDRDNNPTASFQISVVWSAASSAYSASWATTTIRNGGDSVTVPGASGILLSTWTDYYFYWDGDAGAVVWSYWYNETLSYNRMYLGRVSTGAAGSTATSSGGGRTITAFAE